MVAQSAQHYRAPSIALAERHQHVIGTGTVGTGLHGNFSPARFTIEGLGIFDVARLGKCPGGRQWIEVLDPQRLLGGVDHATADREKTPAVVERDLQQQGRPTRMAAFDQQRSAVAQGVANRPIRGPADGARLGRGPVADLDAAVAEAAASVAPVDGSIGSAGQIELNPHRPIFQDRGLGFLPKGHAVGHCHGGDGKQRTGTQGQ